MVAPEIQNLRQVYGEDKVWKQMNREGILASRCTGERLMRTVGQAGASSCAPPKQSHDFGFDGLPALQLT
jgi:hypothetical protein